jgi:tetratricopeptide (TPR) repeat protein
MCRVFTLVVLLSASSPVFAQVWVAPGGGFVVQGRHWTLSAYHSPAFYGWAPNWGYAQQTIIITQPSIVVRQPRLPQLPEPEPVRPVAVQDHRKLDAAVQRGELLVIQPKKLDIAPGLEVAAPIRIPKVILEDEQPPKEAKELPQFETKRARIAFQLEQYGLATERLEAAITANPKEALPWFLLAQVQTARGMYREAVRSIQSGMKLAPDWPATPFKLGELYGGDAKLFDEHFQKLIQAQQAAKDDPLLAFLRGYHEWFLGNRAQAIPLFRQASAVVQDNAVIERFLQETES